MDTLCWCNDCYCRRFPYGPEDKRKFDDCDIQAALDYAFKANEETIIALQEALAWEIYKGGSNG